MGSLSWHDDASPPCSPDLADPRIQTPHSAYLNLICLGHAQDQSDSVKALLEGSYVINCLLLGVEWRNVVMRVCFEFLHRGKPAEDLIIALGLWLLGRGLFGDL